MWIVRSLITLAAVAVSATASFALWTEDDFAGRTPARFAYSATTPGPLVVGRLDTYVVEEGDTLLDIARYFGFGWGDIVGANPGVEAWLPPPGEVVILPGEHVLPSAQGTGLVLNIPEMRLYHFQDGPHGLRQVTTYPVGLGRDEWRTPQGRFKIRAKTERPTWVIPDSIRAERIERDGDARTFIPGGAPDNPLGSYRLSLTLPMYGLHGSNMPWGVGRQVSHGCIRLYEEDVAMLYREVPVGTPGEFLYEPVKVGMRDGLVYVEAHPDFYKLRGDPETETAARLETLGWSDLVDWNLIRKALRDTSGLPVLVSRGGRDDATAPRRSRSGAGPGPRTEAREP